VCPHETVALSAAHAYAMVTGQPQAVMVRVDAGTQNLGGAVNNAMRGRVPVLIFAGAAPFTTDGELPGGRNEFIHWIQDVRDQRGILPAVNRPSAGAAIYCVDVDPLKSQMTMWHVPARRFAQASARLAVEQLARYVRENNLADPSLVEVRRAAAARAHDQDLAERAALEHPRNDGVITSEYLTACVRHLLEDEGALVLTEVVTTARRSPSTCARTGPA
jgi:hypothetical protein